MNEEDYKIMIRRFRGFYPVVATVTDDGWRRVDDTELAERFESIASDVLARTEVAACRDSELQVPASAEFVLEAGADVVAPPVGVAEVRAATRRDHAVGGRRPRRVEADPEHLAPIDAGGSRESDPTDPVGEYAMTALGRERMYEYFSRKLGIPTVLLRLNYATELRYGVLVDLAQQIARGDSIDLAMSYGYRDGPEHDEVQAAIARAEAVLLASKIHVGGLAVTGRAHAGDLDLGEPPVGHGRSSSRGRTSTRRASSWKSSRNLGCTLSDTISAGTT